MRLWLLFEVGHMNGARDDAGAVRILAFARLVADELRAEGRGDLRVLGWIGPTGHQGWEYSVEVGGQTVALEVGEADIPTYPTDASVRRRVEERVRLQMRGLVEPPAEPNAAADGGRDAGSS
jgi:hypothetical protein